MIFEIPSTAAVIEAEDLSGFVKSAYFVSGKLLEWSGARLVIITASLDNGLRVR